MESIQIKDKNDIVILTEKFNDKKALLKRLKHFREYGFSKLSNGWYYNRTVKEHLYTSLHYNL